VKKQAVLLCAAVMAYGLSACAYAPRAIPDDLKTGLSEGLSFKDIILDPKSAAGKRVLLGGVIIEARLLQEKTTLVVLQMPLDQHDRPVKNDQSEGRFLLEWGGRFLDPAIYKAGRELSVIGEITEERIEKIGEMDYRYPVVSASHIYLWQDQIYTPSPFYAPDPYWLGYPYYREPFPYRYPYWSWPRRHPIVFYP